MPPGTEDDLGRIQQAQVRCTREVLSAIETLENTLSNLERMIQQAGHSSSDEQVKQVLSNLESKKLSQSIANTHKVYHAHISKFLKSLDEQTASVIESPFGTSSDEVNRSMLGMVAKHVCWHGYVSTCEALSASGVEIPVEYRVHAQEIRCISDGLINRDTRHAESWIAQYEAQLHEDTAHRLRFEIARLKFLAYVQSREPVEHRRAVALAQSTFPDFYYKYTKEVQSLMGTLLWAGRVDKSPYSDLVSESHTKFVIKAFIQASCYMRGLPSHSHLATAVDVGSTALTTFQKMSALVKTSGRTWESIQELPAEIKLSKRFRFHSVFSCPVSREQATSQNPPVLLKCGHVILKSSMENIVRRGNRFKCPTCYTEMTSEAVLTLHV